MTTPRRTVHLSQVAATLQRIVIAQAAQDAVHAASAQRAVDARDQAAQAAQRPAGGRDE